MKKLNQDEEEKTPQQKEHEKQQKLYKQHHQINENLNVDKLEGLFPFPFSLLSIANSRGGKTYSCMKILENPSYRILERLSAENVYIISPTAKLDQTMTKLIKMLQKQINYDPANIYDDVYQGISIIEDRMKQQKNILEMGEVLPFIVVIIDDAITEFKQPTFKRFIEKIATSGRHMGVSFWLMSQSHKSISNVVRRNCTHIQISQINLQDEMESICKEYRSFMSTKDMLHIVNNIINQKERHYLLICQQRPPSDRFLVDASEVLII